MSRALSDADRRLANVVRFGRIASVDAGAARAVVDFGDFKSPPLPVGQLSAGAIQFWWMPSVGEQVLVACEGGDVAQGCIVASIYAGNAPSADGSTPHIALGGGNMTMHGNLIVNGDVVADGVSLKNHTHSDVLTGPANTGKPN